MRQSPINIDEHNWLYEDDDGLSLVHETIVDGRHIKTDQVTIPWYLLRSSLARKDKRKIPRRGRRP